MPLDPFCVKHPHLKRVDKDDPDLGSLVQYGRGVGAKIYRGEDNKIFVVHKAWGEVPQTSTLAGDTLVEAREKTLQALRAFSDSRKNKARTTRRINEAEKTIAAELNQSEPLSVNDLYTTAAQYLDGKPAMTDVTRYTTGFRVLQELGGAKAMIPLESSLSRMGPAGNALANLFRQANQLEASLKGQAMVRADAALKRLTPDEIEVGFQRYVEHGEVPNPTRRETLEQVRLELTKIMDEFHDGMSRLGIPVKAKVGISELNPTGNYFPHFFDMVALREKRVTRQLVDDVVEAASSQGRTISKEDALQVIAEAGLATNREMAVQRLIRSSAKHGEPLKYAEAEAILERYVSKNAERRSGHVEADRLGVDGYTTNARQAYVTAISRNSRRMAEWTVFGPKDERVHGYLEQIRKTSGKQYGVAKKAYWLEIGKEGAHLSGVARELYNWQAAKLSLAVLSNLTQSANTVTRVGLRPFILAARDAITMSSQDRFAMRRYVERTGAMPKRMFEGQSALMFLQDSLQEVQSNGFAQLLRAVPDNRIIKSLQVGREKLTGFSLSAFEKVEVMNRFLAQRAGEHYFDDIIRVMKTEPKGSQLAEMIARTKELGFHWEPLRKAVIDGDEQAIKFMREIAGVRVSDSTQFRGGVQFLPLWANEHALGKFVYQFKTFALNQARFMTNEVIGPHGDLARRRRAVAAVLLTYPALGYGLAKLRAFTMGETELSQQIDNWLDEAMADPFSMSTLAFGVAAFVQAGSLGILSDIAWSASQGNRFNLTNMFIPPVASTLVNMMDGIGSINSMGIGLLTGDDTRDDQDRLISATSRELGGLGAAFRQQYERLRD